MKLFRQFRLLIRKENWFTHFIVFLTTIAGILIALELDKRRDRFEEEEQLSSYRVRIDNELKINKTRLIFAKQELLRTYHLFRITINAKKLADGGCAVARATIDSLLVLDPGFARQLGQTDTVSATEFIIHPQVQLTPINLSFDIWESLKSSDIMQNVSAGELVQYSNANRSLQHPGQFSMDELFIMMHGYAADGSFDETEKRTFRDQLHMTILDIETKIMIISQSLRELNRERIKDKNEYDNLLEPVDSCKLTL